MFFLLRLITFAERHATFSDLYFNQVRLNFINQNFQIALEMPDRKIPLIEKNPFGAPKSTIKVQVANHRRRLNMT